MCELCMSAHCHPRCPNYTPPKTAHYCSFCEDGIYEGDQYIKNDLGEYRHYDCFYHMDDLLEFLGVSIETMEE